MKRLITLILFVGITFPQLGQVDLKNQLKDYVNPEELVTLSASIPFDQAIDVLSKVSEKLTGRRIVSTAGVTDPIGIEIDKMQYKKALLIIVQYHNLIFEEQPNVIIVKRKSDTAEQLSRDVYAPVDSREVKISALIFEANTTEMRERGINWQFLLSKTGISIGGDFVTLQEQQDQSSGGTGTGGTGTQGQVQQNPPDFNTTTESTFDLGDFSGTATSMFRFFESENLGEIIARPSISVRNGVKGRTQVGSDFSIKERDFAGNLIDKFYSAGTIIEVTPYVYNEDGIDYMLLKLRVERSSVQPDVISTEVRKTEATTEVLMLDGEETAIGGLFINEETNIRRGIPILKDLPWWVFGLRYLFGYDQKQVTKKEIIILVQANIIPTLKERISTMKDTELLKKKLMEHKKELDNIKKQMREASDEEEEK